MKPWEPLETGQRELFRSRLEQIVDTTVQEKIVAFPTDARLINKARTRLVKQPRTRPVVAPIRIQAALPTSQKNA